jgi:tetratricopeptide (TPR) repeat protein
MNILYDEPFQLPRRPIFPVLLETVLNEDVSMAVEQYTTMKSEHEAEFEFSEDQLNMLGYQLLELERYDDAIVIFTLNVDSYPDEFNTYDSLGEAYFLAGEKVLALENLKKSLDLNPDNSHAEDLIRQIEEND